MQTLHAIPTREAPPPRDLLKSGKNCSRICLSSITACLLTILNSRRNRSFSSILTQGFHWPMHSIFMLKNQNWYELIAPVSLFATNPLL